MEKVIDKRIERIIHMEEIYDDLTNIVNNKPKMINDENIQKKIEELYHYYFNGEWLKDYELDEETSIFEGLKRGVLSQDGIYNLIIDIEELKK